MILREVEQIWPESIFLEKQARLREQHTLNIVKSQPQQKDFMR